MVERSGRSDTWHILREVVRDLDPRKLVADSIDVTEAGLSIEGVGGEIASDGRLFVIAVGKAAVPMATGALDQLGERVRDALAVTKAGIPLTVDPPLSLSIIESDHPVPSERSLEAGRRVREMVEHLGEQDTVLMLISGGGSALVEDLIDGISLEDLRQTTDHLLRSGATINELNAVRRRISRLKGGRLAQAAAPARVINLIVSDVLNSPLQDIASGPTVRPPDSDATFEAVMRRDDLLEGLPRSVQEILESQRGSEECWHDNVTGTVVLADAETAARSALESAARLGYEVQSLGYDFQGEAREFGRMWGTIARHAARDRHAFPKPLALVGSGELTVTVRGDGVGGRNTEMALAAALEITGFGSITVSSFATDGDDGLSQCAGGFVDDRTADAVENAGIDVYDRLANNDSASVLRAVDSVIDIGPTGTNVNDVYLALVQGDTTR
jgi:glycerate 2-kinase